MKSDAAFPINADDETKDFVRYWFDLANRKQLTCLSLEIKKIRSSSVRDILWVALSRLVIAKKRGVSLAMDLSHSRPHKAFTSAPIKAFDHFLESVETVIKIKERNSPFLLKKKFKVLNGDARKMRVKNKSIDLVITSPPYLNAIDYIRCSKFTLAWMGFSLKFLRKIRAISVGTENATSCARSELQVFEKLFGKNVNFRKVSSRKQRLIYVYCRDMHKVLQEVHRVLKPSGKAVFVVGNCYLEGTLIDNSKILQKLAADVGLNLKRKTRRELPTNKRYLPPPSNGKGGDFLSKRMRHELVLEFSK